jgi:uncharacterized LabA/DUF88 family protein
VTDVGTKEAAPEIAVLVDYDNIPQPERNKGLAYLAERLVTALTKSASPWPARVRIRLYGGWYEGTTYTRDAQRLAAEAQAIFPKSIRIVAPTHQFTVRVDLAYSLEAEPQHPLVSTYRRRDRVTNVRCHEPRLKGCVIDPCAMHDFEQTFKRGSCPLAECEFTTADLLYRAQQKLVDMMLAVDLIHLGEATKTPVAIVTSDDDLWPAIRLAVVRGSSVVQVHTRPGYRVASYYSRGATVRYAQVDL